MEIITQLGIRRGEDHETFCEDFAIEFQNDKYHYGVILDGCSSGVESHFASTLFAKIFKQTFRNNATLEDIPSFEARSVMLKFYKRLKEVSEILNLNLNELHSTIIFSVYSKETRDLFVYNFGDGVICVDDEIIELENTVYDNPNAPHYFVNDTLGKNLQTHDVYGWLLSHYGQRSFKNVSNFMIASDGLTTFKLRSGFSPDKKEIFEFFFNNNWAAGKLDKSGNKVPVISRKINMLFDGVGQKNGNPFERGEKAVHSDDLSIIRVFDAEILKPKEVLEEKELENEAQEKQV